MKALFPYLLCLSALLLIEFALNKKIQRQKPMA